MKALDPVFELLSRERRRYVLYYLEQENGPVPVSELAAKIQEWESASSAPSSTEKYDQVVLTLKHRDLPKAAEAEFIEYDSARGVIEITGAPSEFRVVLSVAEAIERPGADDVLDLR